MDDTKKDKLGVRSIDSIKPSDAKDGLMNKSENGYAYQTCLKRSLGASFYIAIQDQMINVRKKNPI